MGEYKPPDLFKGLVNRTLGEISEVTGKISETHADFHLQEDEVGVEAKGTEESTPVLAGPEKARVATRMHKNMVQSLAAMG